MSTVGFSFKVAVFDQNRIEPQKPTDPMLYEPEKLPPTENIAVCQLHLHTYVVGPMDFFIDFARRAAHALKMPCSENFEHKTHKRLLEIKDANKDAM
ncbi:3752_t:CDS:2, partial [Entrophospora sp. SA101]